MESVHILWEKVTFITFFVFDIVPAKLLYISVEALQSTAGERSPCDVMTCMWVYVECSK